MDGGISAVGSIFNASWRIATVVYELKAVGEQTRDLLDTTSQVSSTLQHAQVLRRQRSGLLNLTEKKWIDDVLQASDRAVGNVAALIEPARVDMQTQCNKIKFWTRGQFILRDSPKVQVQLGRLGIAAQGLNTAMSVLCNREGISQPRPDGSPLIKVDSGATENELKPPPSYEVVELLDKRRESVLKRRASKLPLAEPMSLDAELNKVKPLEEDPNSLPMVNVHVTEVQPTPITSPQPDRHVEDDGLQVMENHWAHNPWGSSTPNLHSRDPSPAYRYSNHSAASLSPDQYHHPVPRSHSPASRGLDSNSNYFPPPPPGRPPPQPWQQPPVYNYPPPATTANTYPQYNTRSPPDPPSSYLPYSTSSQPQPQPHTTPYNRNDKPLPSRPHPYLHTSASTNTLSSYCHSPETMSTSSNPYPRPLSRSSILTTEELSLGPRQKGRARGRAWLEHQADR